VRVDVIEELLGLLVGEEDFLAIEHAQDDNPISPKDLRRTDVFATDE
jgi:hypothetical protein